MQETQDKFTVGQRVVNVHRPEDKGTIVEILEGCNMLAAIVFDGRDFKSWLPLQDLKSI